MTNGDGFWRRLVMASGDEPGVYREVMLAWSTRTCWRCAPRCACACSFASMRRCHRRRHRAAELPSVPLFALDVHAQRPDRRLRGAARWTRPGCPTSCLRRARARRFRVAVPSGAGASMLARHRLRRCRRRWTRPRSLMRAKAVTALLRSAAALSDGEQLWPSLPSDPEAAGRCNTPGAVPAGPYRGQRKPLDGPLRATGHPVALNQCLGGWTHGINVAVQA